MNANTRNIIAIELMAAAEGIEFRRPLRSSPLLEEAHALIRANVAPRPEDRTFSRDINAVSGLISAGAFAAFAGRLLDEILAEPRA
jgi:histidine ammonia-lyase